MPQRLVIALCAACVLASRESAADPPWQLPLTRRVEADPRGDYRLQDAHGPWLIMATTYAGEDAEANAKQLVLELRREHRWPAFYHPMSFDYSGEVEGRGLDKYGQVKTMRYSQNRRQTEVAVLVGEFPAVDDPDAQKLLDRIKLLTPACMQDDATDDRPLTELRRSQRQTSSRTLSLAVGRAAKSLTLRNNRENLGPMAHAFITTNPLLGREFYVPQGLEPFVVDLNKKVEYSLLKCPGRYSVRVATFNGRVEIDPKKIKKIEQTGDFQSRLEDAAERAHTLTLALRAKGYEAYEFHDRYSSLVTVGSFDSVGQPRSDGKIEINPQVLKIMEVFGAPKRVESGTVSAVGRAKKVSGIALDIQPMPVEVPRASISNRLEKPSLGMLGGGR